MGIEIPPDWPEILDDKIYGVSVDRFGLNPPDGGCNNPFFDNKNCCVRGVNLNEWINNDWQCTGKELCAGPPHALHQRLEAVWGPFDDWPPCFATLF